MVRNFGYTITYHIYPCISRPFTTKKSVQKITRLINGSKTDIKKSSGQLSIVIIVLHGNEHPLSHGTSLVTMSFL